MIQCHQHRWLDSHLSAQDWAFKHDSRGVILTDRQVRFVSELVALTCANHKTIRKNRHKAESWLTKK